MTNTGGEAQAETQPIAVVGLLVVALLAGAGFWLSDRPSTPPSVEELSVVDVADLKDALSTMIATPGERASIVAKAQSCQAPLASVVVSNRHGVADSIIHIRSGLYTSPPFLVSETPQRIALPFPAPYEQGNGTITIIGDSAQIDISLRSTLRLPNLHGETSTHVTWRVAKSCGENVP